MVAYQVPEYKGVTLLTGRRVHKNRDCDAKSFPTLVFGTDESELLGQVSLVIGDKRSSRPSIQTLWVFLRADSL